MFKECYSLHSPVEEWCTLLSFSAFVASGSDSSSSSGSVTSSYSGNRNGEVFTVVVSTQTKAQTIYMEKMCQWELHLYTHLGCCTPSCVCVSNGESGGVFHSKSQCGSESKSCFHGNHTPNKASLQKVTRCGLVQSYQWVPPLNQKR